MTVIAAITDGHTCWVGGDSAGVTGHSVMIRAGADAKVFTVTARRATEQDPVTEFAFGCCGSPRMRQLLRHTLALPSPPLRGDDLHWFMCTTFIDAVRDCFRAGGWARKEDDRELGGNFIVGVHGRLFEVFTDYHVAERDGSYTATGAGEFYALGSLHATAKIAPTMLPELRLEMAMEAAAEFCAGIRSPFRIVSVTAPVLTAVTR